MLWLSVVVMGASVGERNAFPRLSFPRMARLTGHARGSRSNGIFAWAILHTQYQLLFIIQIFLIGLALGFARLPVTGSTISTILLHVFLNALGLERNVSCIAFLSLAVIAPVSARGRELVDDLRLEPKRRARPQHRISAQGPTEQSGGFRSYRARTRNEIRGRVPPPSH